MIRAYADAGGHPPMSITIPPMAAADGVDERRLHERRRAPHREAGYAVMERILPPVVKRVQAEIGK